MLKPTQTCAYYTYWAGLELAEGELHAFPGVMAVLWPTNDGLAFASTLATQLANLHPSAQTLRATSGKRLGDCPG